MERADFQRLADERLADAEALIVAGRPVAAYYLCGYAVECALKACIARLTKQDTFPPREAPKYYVHDLTKLLDYSGVDVAFRQEVANDPDFAANWAVAKDWSEETRYQVRERKAAGELISAINDNQHGVLQWLKRNW
jgi:HEPN domain-containing protein